MGASNSNFSLDVGKIYFRYLINESLANKKCLKQKFIKNVIKATDNGGAQFSTKFWKFCNRILNPTKVPTIPITTDIFPIEFRNFFTSTSSDCSLFLGLPNGIDHVLL